MFKWHKHRRDSVDAAGRGPRPGDLRCSFCSKVQSDVRLLIAGPAVFICDECVDVCVDIITEDRDVQEVPQDPAGGLRPTGVNKLLLENALACALCSKPSSPNRVLPIANRGVLCGECADAVEDALSQGKTSVEPDNDTTERPADGTTVVDRNGQPVRVGTRVRVLEIPAFLERDLPPDEVEDLATMVGEVFEVYEIDEAGGACVEKIWYFDGGQRSHSLALEAHEMEVA